MSAAPRTYRFHRGRLARNLTALVPIAGFPVVLHLTGRADSGVDLIFGTVGAAFLFGVFYSAARFKVTVDDDGLTVRGRIRRRHVAWTDIAEVELRRGRDKPQRFMGPPPFRELVLRIDAGGGKRKRRLVLSSLPLGEEAFEAVVDAVTTRVPAARPT